MGPYMKATVLFERKEAVESLRNTWSINYLKNLVRIEPAQMSNEEREIREAYVMKLTNLPFGVTAYDLKTLIEAVKAKTCLLPRTRGNYTRLRYAYMSFANEDDMQNAITSTEQYEIKGNRLYWVDAEAKVCHKCASPDHLIKNCTEIEKANEFKNRRAQFSKIYTRFRVPNYKKITNHYYNNRQKEFDNQHQYNRQEFNYYSNQNYTKYDDDYSDQRFQNQNQFSNFRNSQQQNFNNQYRNDNQMNNNVAKDNNNQNTIGQNMSNKDVMGMLMMVTKGLDEIKKDLDLIKKRVDNLENHTKIPINDKNPDNNQTVDKQQTVENVINDDTN